MSNVECNVEKIFEEIYRKYPDAVHPTTPQSRRFVIGIDGRCGSGKTTLSTQLAAILKAPVIHMDDFFLPFELRTKERLSQAGGNIHYERFCEEIIKKIKVKNPFEYRIFDCSKMDYIGKTSIPSSQIIIVEGVYSTHPLFEEIYDFKIFCDISKPEQKRRILHRDGLHGYQNFETRWIPMEETYFSTYQIKELCDYVVVL